MSERSSFYAQLVRYGSVVFLFPAAIAVGFGLGYLGDRSFSTFPWLSTIGLVLGIAAGFLQLFRLLGKSG